LPGSIAIVAALAGGVPAHAQEPEGWTLHVSGERAGVTLFDQPGTWWTGRVQLGVRREGKGGAFGAVEAYRRFGLDDVTVVAAGWRHAGPWSFYAEGGVTPDANFYYRHSAEVEAYRTIRSSRWVPHLGYRYWRFPQDSVHLLSPRITRYGARSEIHARLILVRNATRDTDSAAVFARGWYDATPRLRLGGGFAKGERIFDVTSLPRDPAPGWVVFGEARVGVTARDAVGVVLRAAEEKEDFDLFGVTLSYRRAF
jgi:YaiO family outer membrane protein